MTPSEEKAEGRSTGLLRRYLGADILISIPGTVSESIHRVSSTSLKTYSTFEWPLKQ
jgi:hypothetical protein